MQVVLIDQFQHLRFIIWIRAVAFRNCIRPRPDADRMDDLLCVRHTCYTCVFQPLVVADMEQEHFIIPQALLIVCVRPEAAVNICQFTAIVLRRFLHDAFAVPSRILSP